MNRKRRRTLSIGLLFLAGTTGVAGDDRAEILKGIDDRQGLLVAALRDAGLEIAENPTSKKDLAAIQAQMNVWARETGLPYLHLSRILSMSIGENRSAEALRAYMEE